MKIQHYEPGDEEDNIWAGDIVSHCEFVHYLPFGIMIFREIKPCPCMRAVFYEVAVGGEVILNGWNAYETIRELKADLRKQLDGN
jgi:hypothetical protein